LIFNKMLLENVRHRAPEYMTIAHGNTHTYTKMVPRRRNHGGTSTAD
jgi:hypothetical protein